MVRDVLRLHPAGESPLVTHRQRVVSLNPAQVRVDVEDFDQLS
jgi:hypothetical protein